MLAFLVAALAVPFLVLNAADSAEGVETAAGDIESSDDVSSEEEAVAADSSGITAPAPVEFVVTQEEVSPDVERLSAQASTWAIARAEAVADGLVSLQTTPPPSETDLSLLPVVTIVIPEAPAPETGDTTTTTEAPAEGAPTETAPGGEAGEGTEGAGGQAGEGPEAGEAQPESEPEPEEAAEAPAEDPRPAIILAAPAQVGGRVPPPVGGPTAEQWDALRFCESTHNYGAISPSGLYRGAYQFSQQTWDWVAGIHFEFLVGLDPAEAPPGWQDVMAYTLFAMRGWDQWPVCGTNLL